MLKEFLDRLLELKRPETVEVHGRVYSTLGLNPVGQPMAEPGSRWRCSPSRTGSSGRAWICRSSRNHSGGGLLEGPPHSFL